MTQSTIWFNSNWPWTYDTFYLDSQQYEIFGYLLFKQSISQFIFEEEMLF